MRDLLVCDVSPRDGLQNERVILDPAIRTELSVRLARAGLGRVEVASFVNPDRVPAMAGAEDVAIGLPEIAGCEWTGLALNERGFARAVASGLHHVNFTLAATESFCLRNQGATRDDAEAALGRLAHIARIQDITLTVTLAVSFGCPFEGRVRADEVLAVAERILAHAPDELVFADTIGVAVPATVTAVLARLGPVDARIGLHMHDTRSTAIANCMAALGYGVDLFDTSAGGTGGCPFAPGAGGNLATEDLLYTLEECGIATGVDLDEVRRTSEWLGEHLGYRLPSAVGRVGGFPMPVSPGV